MQPKKSLTRQAGVIFDIGQRKVIKKAAQRQHNNAPMEWIGGILYFARMPREPVPGVPHIPKPGGRGAIGLSAISGADRPAATIEERRKTLSLPDGRVPPVRSTPRRGASGRFVRHEAVDEEDRSHGHRRMSRVPGGVVTDYF